MDSWSYLLLIVMGCSLVLLTKSDVTEEQLKVLKELYAGSNGEYWRNNTGWDKLPVCYEDDKSDWHGIICKGNVIAGIDLSNNNVTGKIPLDWDSFTQSLTLLNFSNNHIVGKVPSRFWFHDLIFIGDNNDFDGVLNRNLCLLKDFSFKNVLNFHCPLPRCCYDEYQMTVLEKCGKCSNRTTMAPFSVYKDVTVNLDRHYDFLRTNVTGKMAPLLDVFNAPTVIWGTATGRCLLEEFDGVIAYKLVVANVRRFINAKTNYMVSVGGKSGKFWCYTLDYMRLFLKKYHSQRFVGVDFDLRSEQTKSDEVYRLIELVHAVQDTYGHLRFSFTLKAVGGNQTHKKVLNKYGLMVLDSIKKVGLENYIINLVVADVGTPSTDVCILDFYYDKRCDMARTAIQAVRNLNSEHNVTFSKIALTSVIGVNGKEEFLAGAIYYLVEHNARSFNNQLELRYLSYDRDKPCSKLIGPDPHETCNFFRYKPLVMLGEFLTALTSIY